MAGEPLKRRMIRQPPPFNIEAFYEQFRLDPEYGFVSGSRERGNYRLPAQYGEWERIAEQLLALSTTGQLRPLIEKVRHPCPGSG